jgi:hypothetical protein
MLLMFTACGGLITSVEEHDAKANEETSQGATVAGIEEPATSGEAELPAAENQAEESQAEGQPGSPAKSQLAATDSGSSGSSGEAKDGSTAAKDDTKSGGAAKSGSDSKDSTSTGKDGKKPAGTNDSKKPAKNPGNTPTATDPAKPVQATITCTVTVDCKTLYAVDPDLAAKFGTNGVMLAKKTVTLKKGATAYDALKASGIKFVGKTYISGIGGLSEGDITSESGWVYNVGGVFPGVGVTVFELKDGDSVAFRYTIDGGPDVGSNL